jgi:endonuclease/exonuclease/phosphatase (EEP) superfamily protein YafD
MEDQPLEIVGLRVPFCRRLSPRKYWESLHEIVASVRDRRILFVGDLNADPERQRGFGSRCLRELEGSGWHVPRPKGEWSFEGRTLLRSRIDHAVLSPALGRAAEARYEADLNGVRIAGKCKDAASDHAALVVELPTL